LVDGTEFSGTVGPAKVDADVLAFWQGDDRVWDVVGSALCSKLVFARPVLGEFWVMAAKVEVDL
jgi:hypothetical protein